MFCKECGNQIPDTAAICMKCGVPTGITPVPGIRVAKSRSAYVLLGFFLGQLGIHNFYAGYTAKAVAQLLISVLLGWLVVPLIAVWIWALVEICTIKQDAQGVKFE